MALIENTLEGGVEGTNVTAANSGGLSGTAFTTVTTPATQSQYRAAAAYIGNFGMAVTALSANAPIVDFDDAAPAASFALRFYLRMDSYPSVSDIQFPLALRTLSGVLGRTDFASDGGIRINGGTYSTSKLALATWYRIEMQGTGFGAGAGAATINLQVYVGSNTGTPYITQTLSSLTIASQIQRVRYGKISNAPTTADFTYAMDNFAQNVGSSTPIGPAVDSGPNAGSDQSVSPGVTVTLTGTGTGTWSQVGGSPTVALNIAGAVATFTSPYTASGTTLTFDYGGDTMDVVVAAAATITAVTNTGEGGVAGGTVTIGNSGGASGTAFPTVSAGTGGTITYESTGAYRGNLSYKFVQPNAANANLVDLDGPSADSTFSVRVYVKVTSYPTVNNMSFPISMRSAGGSPIGSVDMNTSGQVRVTGSSSSTYSTAALALNTWYRVEYYGWGWGSSSSNAVVDVYVGDATGTPYATSSFSGITTNATVIRARFGKVSSTPAGVIGYMLDDFAVKIGTPIPIGPSSGGGGGTAGIDQSVEPWSTVTLTGTGTGTWTQVGGSPTVTLNGSGLTRTFTAPGVLVDTDLTFDFGGDTVVVTVWAATERAVVGGVEIPMQIIQVSST